MPISLTAKRFLILLSTKIYSLAGTPIRLQYDNSANTLESTFFASVLNSAIDNNSEARFG